MGNRVAKSLARLLREIFEKLPNDCDISYKHKIDELINIICLHKLVEFMKNSECNLTCLEDEMFEYENLIFLCKQNSYYRNRVFIILEIQVSLCLQKYTYTGDYNFKYMSNNYKKMISDLLKEVVHPMTYLKIEHKFKNRKFMLPNPKMYI
ncbi:MAG: hypothetical protein K0S51_1312 [Bacillales bacterium]|nr:hypothetical protein [Bacillales bacterium]